MGKTNRHNDENSKYANDNEVMLDIYRVQGVWDGFRIAEPEGGIVFFDLNIAIERARDYASNVLSHYSHAQSEGKEMPTVRVLEDKTRRIVWEWESPLIDLT